MNATLILLIIILAASGAFFVGRQRAMTTAGGKASALHSLPSYYGWYSALWVAIPGLVLLLVWSVASPRWLDSRIEAALPNASGKSPAEIELMVSDIRRSAMGDISSRQVDSSMQQIAEEYRSMKQKASFGVLALALALGGMGLAKAWLTISPKMRARPVVERFARILLVTSSVIAVLTTIGIIVSLFFESWRFFQKIPLTDFLFGTEWAPQIAMRADQAASSGAFGAVPLFVGTFLIMLVAMLVAVPLGLMSAIYMTQYADPRVRAWMKPGLEILAGVPTVVYGFFAALVIAPLLRNLGAEIGINIASESAMGAGLVMGIMIIPFVSSLSDDAIAAVPQAMRDGSYGLGATKSETIKLVLIPAALPGIVGAILLAVSRAIGETMIVVMAAGLAANMTFNPLEAVTTVTTQIVALLTGDQEFDSVKTLSAFALGIVLFFVTLGLNVAALTVVKKYRELYE